jgi:hypothetical protein
MRYTQFRDQRSLTAKNFDEFKLFSILMGSMSIKIFSVYDIDNEITGNFAQLLNANMVNSMIRVVQRPRHVSRL